MSSWGLVFREGRQRKETGQPQSWSAHPPGRGLYSRRRAKRGTRESTSSQTKVKQPAHILSAVFKSNVFRGWRSAMSSSFPQSYCCHLSSLHISYWLSSKGDETLIFHISPPNLKRLPSFE